ncbi:MAG: hypothetical protein HFG89_13100 [Dorea sp.]|nr:hypothetical protein [Dorea sp.]
MKRFIRYLYEYEHGRRLRNVGFVKAEQSEDECTLHIHGKGLHMKGERKLTVYLFFNAGNECVGIWQGTIDNVNPAINYRLHYTEEDTGSPDNFQKIDGIILESEMGHKYAAVWDDKAVDIGNMRVLDPAKDGRIPREEIRQEEPEPAIEEDSREESDMGADPERSEDPWDRLESVMQREPQESRNNPEPQQGDESEKIAESVLEDEMRDESEPMPEEEIEENSQKADAKSQETCGQEDEQETPVQRDCQCTKIQRNDIARLPRCEWKWANNSFLLHGYYNYHHLALIHEGNRFLLGVPGIYHPQEAKAASVFGFTEFIPVRDMEVDLTDEEGNGRDQFGYWCRPVKRPLKM